MSEEDRFVEVRAPITKWEFFLKTWYVWLGLLGVLIFLVLKDFIPPAWQYAYWTAVGVFGVVYWFLGLPEGWALDTREIQEGRISLEPLTRYQLEKIDTTRALLLMSQSGTVALLGHKLISIGEDGKPTIHPLIELQTNSEVARRVGKIQGQMIDEYLVLKSVPEVASAEKFKEMEEAWRKKLRLDPEAVN